MNAQNYKPSEDTKLSKEGFSYIRFIADQTSFFDQVKMILD